MRGGRPSTSDRVDRRGNDASPSRRPAGRDCPWSRRKRRSQRQSRRRLVHCEQSRRLRRCHGSWQRLLWRHRPNRSIRHAISTAGPCFVNAIGDKRLALEKLQRLFRPVNAIAEPVGNVYRAVPIQMDYSSLRDIEIRVMAGDHGIVEDRVLQLCRAFDSARNHRVGVNRTRYRNRVGRGKAGVGEQRLPMRRLQFIRYGGGSSRRAHPSAETQQRRGGRAHQSENMDPT